MDAYQKIQYYHRIYRKSEKQKGDQEIMFST